MRFPWKLYKTLFSGHAQLFLAKSQFGALKFSKASHWPNILFKTGKQCAFHENSTKGFFQVMRSTFWPNRICERQSSQNRHTGFKFSSKRENSALSIKSVQNTHFRSCAARFGQIAFWIVKVFKIVMASNSLQHRKTVRFPWKLYKTLFQVMRSTFQSLHWPIVTLASNSLQNGKIVRFSSKFYKTLFWGHVQHVLAKSHFGASKFSKSWNWPQILFKTEKQFAFHENCTKRSFQVMRNTFCPNRILERQSSQHRHTGLEFPSKRKNSALSIKTLQNALLRSCAARFGQIAFLRVKVFRIVKLASNSLQNGKTVRSSYWIVQNALFRSCAGRFRQIAFWSVKVFKIVMQAWNSAENGKTVRFLWKVYKTLFSGHAEHVSIVTLANRYTGLKFPSKRKNSALFIKILQNALLRSCAARFGQIAFWSVKVLKIVKLASNSL